jgi:hypothetical protein
MIKNHELNHAATYPLFLSDFITYLKHVSTRISKIELLQYLPAILFVMSLTLNEKVFLFMKFS